ncbi:hypothetical protein ACFV7Q_23315 [Streptomyces sp. NPDC059851]|uniref:hypothetical protein n=1 Tax=Streptomyces sp. NPDC059851 TaxID=3346971 RepID=UPI0036552868
MVAGIAAARLRRSLKIGLATLGLDVPIEIVAQHRDERLRTGIVDAADRSWHVTLYLNATGTEPPGVQRRQPRAALEDGRSPLQPKRAATGFTADAASPATPCRTASRPSSVMSSPSSDRSRGVQRFAQSMASGPRAISRA